MNATWVMIEWWPRAMLAGGVILLTGYALARAARDPGMKARFAGWSAAAALLALGIAALPAWLQLPAWKGEASRAVADVAWPDPPEEVRVFVPVEESEPAPEALPVVRTDERTATVARPERRTVSPVVLLFGLYSAGVGLGLARLLLAQWSLGRLDRRSKAAPGRLRDEFRSMGGAGYRLRVADRLAGPVCFGLLRPTVVLPRDLIARSTPSELRWVLAHELCHLRHGDPWARLWMGCVQAVYFVLPWSWWLARQARLAQEHRADAAAVGAVPAGATEYADFLVRLSRHGRRCRPAPLAVGVRAGSSDLYRRVNMVLNESKSVGKSGRRWLLPVAVGFLGAAVVLAGLNIGARADENPPAADEDEGLGDSAKKARDAALEALKQALRGQLDDEDRPAPDLPPALEEQFEQMRQQIEEMRQRMGMRALPLPEGFPNLPGGLMMPFGDEEDPFGGLFGQRSGAGQRGRLGVTINAPTPVLIEQLDLPEGQGMVITEVAGDSAAERAGLKANDILLQFDGRSVPSDPALFVEMVSKAKADEEFAVVVLRKGRKETIEGVKLPEARAEEDQPRPFRFQLMPALPPLPPLPPAVPGDGDGSQMSVQVNGDRFTAKYREGDLSIVTTGTVKGGTKVESIEIRDGDTEVTADKIDDVPEEYRGRVEKMLKQFSVVD